MVASIDEVPVDPVVPVAAVSAVTSFDAASETISDEGFPEAAWTAFVGDDAVEMFHRV